MLLSYHLITNHPVLLSHSSYAPLCSLYILTPILHPLHIPLHPLAQPLHTLNFLRNPLHLLAHTLYTHLHPLNHPCALLGALNSYYTPLFPTCVSHTNNSTHLLSIPCASCTLLLCSCSLIDCNLDKIDLLQRGTYSHKYCFSRNPLKNLWTFLE